MTDTTNPSELREEVRRQYANRAKRIIGDPEGGCCGGGECDPISRNLYDAVEEGEVPADAVLASLGCGNPVALAELHQGETVLDLGSGGGIDVLLSAKRVGPTGFAYGLDMTDEMLELANRNRREAGAENVEFLKGHIEAIPLPEAAVDVVISNCVINLSTDKPRVIAETFRVLRPGGRFAVSDMVVQGTFPDDVRTDAEAWAGCIAGALEEDEYRRILTDAGFEDVDVEVTRIHDRPELAGRFDGKLVSAFIRATKPAPKCCAGSC